jgi:hypothetical protein
VANGRAADILRSEEHGEIVPTNNTKKESHNPYINRRKVPVLQAYKILRCKKP